MIPCRLVMPACSVGFTYFSTRIPWTLEQLEHLNIEKNATPTLLSDYLGYDDGTRLCRWSCGGKESRPEIKFAERCLGKIMLDCTQLHGV